MILLDYYPDDNSKLIKQCLVKALGKLPKKIDDVLKDYFDDFKQGWAGTHIMSLCVLPQYRRLRVATRLLQSLDNNKDYSLACIKDNYPARVLYEKCGFEFEKEYLGYTAVKCVELIKRGKHE